MPAGEVTVRAVPVASVAAVTGIPVRSRSARNNSCRPEFARLRLKSTSRHRASRNTRRSSPSTWTPRRNPGCRPNSGTSKICGWARWTGLEIDKVVLSQTGPGVQGETNIDVAIRRAAEGNDYLAQQIQRHPARYAGLRIAAYAFPEGGCERADPCRRSSRLQGRVGQRPHPRDLLRRSGLRPLLGEDATFGRAAIPASTDPCPVPKACDGHPELTGAVWGWGVETASRALSLLFGGMFDRFPRRRSSWAIWVRVCRCCAGVSTAGSPFTRTALACARALGILRTQYLDHDLGRLLLLAGAFGALGEMGDVAVMFSVNYPYDRRQAQQIIDRAPLSEDVRVQVCPRNAERLFKLTRETEEVEQHRQGLSHRPDQLPSSNTTMETEIPAMLDGASIHRARQALHVSFEAHAHEEGREGRARRDGQPNRIAAPLELSDARVDVLGYACLVAIMSDGDVVSPRLAEAAA